MSQCLDEWLLNNRLKQNTSYGIRWILIFWRKCLPFSYYSTLWTMYLFHYLKKHSMKHNNILQHGHNTCCFCMCIIRGKNNFMPEYVKSLFYILNIKKTYYLWFWYTLQKKKQKQKKANPYTGKIKCISTVKSFSVITHYY